MTPFSSRSNPFPGLRPFNQDEDYLFFGREEQTLELLKRLGGNRLLAVVGSSGSGKSSLVRCGLLSELLGGRMLEAGAAWEVAVTHPGGNPLGLLTDALLQSDLYDREAEYAKENLLATLSRSHFGLIEAVKQAGLPAETNFLLVVDQFEEIFRFNESGQRQQEQADEFVSLILEAVAQRDVAIYVVLTMRSDFIGDCGQFEGLAEMVNQGEFLIPRLNRDQFKRIIEGPIKVAGGQIAPRLLQRLLNDLGQQADQLPCLQHALMRTWDVWAEKGDAEALDLDDYQRVGRMSQSLSLHADEVYGSLASNRQRELCRGIFQALTVEESNSRGVRRPQRMGRLCEILEVSFDELRQIIDAFRQPGVTFLTPAASVELTEQTIIDLSHESLMRVWTRLRLWVEEETQAAGIYHRLSESADLHERGKAGLYRDPELGIALAWRESKRPNAAWADRYRAGFQAAMAFLETSQRESLKEKRAHEAARLRELKQAQELAEVNQLRLEQQQRATASLRKMLAGLTIVAIVAGIACIAAMMANQRANRLARDARENEVEARRNADRAARSEEEAKQALSIVASQKTDIEASLAKAQAAERIAQTAEEMGRKVLYTTDLRLAPFVWRGEQTTALQLQILLDRHDPRLQTIEHEFGPQPMRRPDLRGFEWHYYHHLLEHTGTVFAGSEQPVTDVAFTAAGGLATLDQNAQFRRWNRSTHQDDEASRRNLLGTTTNQVHCLSPDGKRAAVFEGSTFYFFNTDTGEVEYQIKSETSGSRRATFSRNGQWVAIVDDQIRWFRSDGGEEIASTEFTSGYLSSTALSADGLKLAVMGQGQNSTYWSAFKLDPDTTRITPLAHDISVGSTISRAAAISPDGKWLSLGFALSGDMAIFDLDSGRMIKYQGAAHPSPILAVDFSQDGSKLATGDREGTIKIWTDLDNQVTSRGPLLTFKGHRSAIQQVRFDETGQELVSAGDDKTARVWKLKQARAAIRRLPGTAGTTGAAFSPDGQLMAVASGSSLRLWEVASGDCVRELSAAENDLIGSVAFSPTDHRLLAVGYGGPAERCDVALWDLDSGVELVRLAGVRDLPDFDQNSLAARVGALAFSPDGKFLVAGFGSPSLYSTIRVPTPLKVWDVASRQLIRHLSGHEGFCLSLDFSPDGKWLASGSRDGKAIIWSTETWQPFQTLSNPDPGSLFSTIDRPGMVENVAFSPNGKLLAMGSREGKLYFWDAETGELRSTLQGHSAAVNAIDFAPDGLTIASGGGDGTIRLWNVETGRELMQLDPGDVTFGQVRAVSFSPQGRHLLAGGISTAAIWSAERNNWTDPDRASHMLKSLLASNADFSSRIRMFSENLQLHEALARLDLQNRKVQAALAATQANWYASRHQWSAAVAAYDRLRESGEGSAEDWLRTPGLLRLATALTHQQRPKEAAKLLSGGATRRAADGLPKIELVGIGVDFSYANSLPQISELIADYPGSRGSLRPGDIVLKVDDEELNLNQRATFRGMLAGAAGTRIRLTVKHPDTQEVETVELTRHQFVNDPATGESLRLLKAAIEQHLATEPQNADLLQLRGELAGQLSDAEAQLADYTAAIEVLERPDSQTSASRLQELYAARANVYASLTRWREAAADYDRAVGSDTRDETLLARQANARAETLLLDETWTTLTPLEATSEMGSTLLILPDNSILATGANPNNDRYRIVCKTDGKFDLAAVRLEALTHPSLPEKGPGREVTGRFGLNKWVATATPPDGSSPIELQFDASWDDQNTIDGSVGIDGSWNLTQGLGSDHVAVWSTPQTHRLPAGTTLTLVIQCQLNHPMGGNLGRFRLSASNRSGAIKRIRLHQIAAKAVDPWQKLAAAYRFSGHEMAIDELVHRWPAKAGPIGDLFTQSRPNEQEWRQALQLYAIGLAAAPDDRQLLARRARASEEIQDWDAAAIDWFQAAAANQEGAKQLADFARRQTQAGRAAQSLDAFQRSQAIYEQLLDADPLNDVVVGELTKLLLDKYAVAAANWTVLRPLESRTEIGTAFQQQPDGSIRFEPGQNESPQLVRWQPEPGRISAIRIETGQQVPHESDQPPRFSESVLYATSAGTTRPATVRGRFVRLDLPDESPHFPRLPSDNNLRMLNLAELQVFDGNENAALKKNVRYSSKSDQARYSPERAVDGNTDGKDDGHPYYHSSVEKRPWFEVDLGRERTIDRIVVWNRNEPNARHLGLRMNHFRVQVLDQDRQLIFEQVIDKAPDPATEIDLRTRLSMDSPKTSVGETPWRILLPAGTEASRAHSYRVSATSLSYLWNALDLDAATISDATTRLAVAYAMNDHRDQAVIHFRRALKQQQTFEARRTVVHWLERFHEIFSTLTVEQPDDPQLPVAWAFHLGNLAQEHAMAGQTALAASYLEQARAIFSRLRAKFPEPQWTIVVPGKATSDAGATFAIQDDGSILVSGPASDREKYTLTVPAGPGKMTAVRLETIPHLSLPKAGAGRNPDGSFMLTEFSLLTPQPAGGLATLFRKLAFADAFASYHRIEGQGHEYPIQRAFDNAATAWDVWPKVYERQWAIFILDPPWESARGTPLQVQLSTMSDPGSVSTLGHFRLSVTSDDRVASSMAFLEELESRNAASVLTLLAHIEASQGRLNEATQSFRMAIDLSADKDQIGVVIAAALRYDGILTRLVSEFGQNPAFLMALAQPYHDANQQTLKAAREQAIPAIEQAATRLPLQAEMANAFADLLLTRLVDTVPAPLRLKIESLTDPWLKLATVDALCGRTAESVARFTETLQQTDDFEGRQTILNLASEFDEVMSSLVNRRPDDLQAQSTWAYRLAERGQTKIAAGDLAAAQALLQSSQDIWQRVVGELDQSKWTVLKPVHMSASGDETLSLERDGSIFVSGSNSARAIYTINMRGLPEQVTALRLETIPDHRLPGGGAGREAKGNFQLADIAVRLAHQPPSEKPTPIEFSTAIVDSPLQNRFHFIRLIDGDPLTGWDAAGQPDVPHCVILIFKTPVSVSDGELQVRLDSGISDPGPHGLGRFRLSATSASRIAELIALREQVHKFGPHTTLIRLATIFALQGRMEAAADAWSQVLQEADDRSIVGNVIEAAAMFPGLLTKIHERLPDKRILTSEVSAFLKASDRSDVERELMTFLRSGMERQLVAGTFTAADADQLTELILSRSPVHWTLLTPQVMTSSQGATLTLQADNSILASGPNRGSDLYTVTFIPELDQIASLRLEAIPDDGLPAGGPGRGESGNFQLNSLRLFELKRADADERRRLELDQAIARGQFPSENVDLAGTINESADKFWHVDGRPGAVHEGLFQLQEVARLDRGRTTLLVELLHQDFSSGVNLGRFRVSATADADAIHKVEQWWAARRTIANIENPWRRLGCAFQYRGDEQAVELLKRHHPDAISECGE